MWRCILCGTKNRTSRDQRHDREGSPCRACRSSWRSRVTVLALMRGLEVRPRPVPELDSDWSRRGVGCSDHPSIAAALPSRISYTNTHLERFPVLDIAAPPASLTGELEFILCSDVLEHVEPPAQRGFDGLAAVLRPGGFAVLSVPIHDAARTEELYPGLVQYEVLDGPVVQWSDAAGNKHVDETPEMHGGQGLVLAFRRFARADVVERLEAAGFVAVEELTGDQPGLGVWPIDGAGVFLARRG